LANFPTGGEVQLAYFPPWSLFFLAAVPLALLNLFDAHLGSAGGSDHARPRPIVGRLPGWLYHQPADDGQRFARGVLATVYLAWAGTALVLQKQYHYVHVPETLLMLALFAANRWAIAFPGCASRPEF